jgi:hypothetical protein
VSSIDTEVLGVDRILEGQRLAVAPHALADLPPATTRSATAKIAQANVCTGVSELTPEAAATA